MKWAVEVDGQVFIVKGAKTTERTALFNVAQYLVRHAVVRPATDADEITAGKQGHERIYTGKTGPSKPRAFKVWDVEDDTRAILVRTTNAGKAVAIGAHFLKIRITKTRARRAYVFDTVHFNTGIRFNDAMASYVAEGPALEQAVNDCFDSGKTRRGDRQAWSRVPGSRPSSSRTADRT